MKYANWALLVAFYTAGIVVAAALLEHGNEINGTLGGVMGAAAVLFVTIPSFIQWQDRCLGKADQRGRRAIDTVIEAFSTEIREQDLRHQEDLRRHMITYSEAVARAEVAESRADSAEERLARMNQGPKTWHERHRTASLPPAPTTPLS
jgi:hypothetical protein